MNILQVNSWDRGGGAEKIAWQLFEGFCNRGHQSRFLVGHRKTGQSQVIYNDYGNKRQKFFGEIDKYLEKLFKAKRGLYFVRKFLHYLSEPQSRRDRAAGLIDYNFVGTEHLLDEIDIVPDIIHFHNLHGEYFNLNALSKISKQVPIIWTLHDEWAYSGFCCLTLGCSKWEIGCGSCPQIGRNYPFPDSTHDNWQIKRNIYKKGDLVVCAPSKWLLDRAQRSILKAREYYFIPNGVNTSIFKPANQSQIRQNLDIPINDKVVLFTAAKSPWKDHETVEKAVLYLSEMLHDMQVTFLCLGTKGKTKRKGNLQIRFVPYQTNEIEVAKYYQAADVYLHAAKAEAFGLVIIEALACGTPVIATNVGGIPEIIDDGETGYLVSPESPKEMAQKAAELLRDRKLYSHMQKTGIECVLNNFTLEKMFDSYLSLYEKIISSYPRRSLH